MANDAADNAAPEPADEAPASQPPEPPKSDSAEPPAPPAPVTEPAATPEPVAQPQVEPVAEADPDPEPAATEPTPVAEPEPVAEPTPVPEPTAEAEPVPAPVAEPTPEAAPPSEPVDVAEAPAPDPAPTPPAVAELLAAEGLRNDKSRTGSPWWAKTLVGLGVLLMVVAGGGAVYAKILLDRIDNAGTEKQLLGVDDSRAGDDIKGPLNLLMVGTDMRVNDSDNIDRADSIMILHINADLTEASIVSVPRDLKVPCNGEPEGSCYTKVNGTYADGGDTQEERFQGLAKALGKLTGIKEFDGAAIVGFDGFLKAVKVMGSVELCLPFDMQLHHQMKEQPNKPRTFKKGCRDYNQREALWIVRERYAYNAGTPGFDPEWGVGDYGRQHMQQHFIKQLLKRAAEDGYITNPAKVGDLIETVGSSLTYHFRGHTPVEMAWALKGVKPDRMRTARLPSESSTEFGQAFEVIPQGEPEKVTEALFKALREDTVAEWMADNPKLLNKD